MKSRSVYLVSTRVYLASIVAQVAAAGLFIGVLGAVFTWGDHSALFDFANSPHGVSKPELGFLFGPAAILTLLPLVRHRVPRVAYTARYRSRLGAALALWAIGLALLLAHLAGLDSEYTLQAGAYIATALIVIGLLASLAMWPGGLPTGLFDRRGGVEAASTSGSAG
jgi:hypothetical protein